MSFPNIPPVSPAIEIDREDAINLLLASIAFEELGLAHLINAEAEKIQYALGTLTEVTPEVPPTLDELIELNQSVNGVLRSAIKTQMLLQFKLEDSIAASATNNNTATPVTTA